jgi:hypothetical protein
MGVDSSRIELLVVITETETWLLSENCIRARGPHALTERRVEELADQGMSPARYGTLLFRSVFPEGSLSTWVFTQLQGSQRFLHIQLAIASRRLEPLWWECLTIPAFEDRQGTALACTNDSSLARQLPQEMLTFPPTPRQELGVLFASPNPVNLDEWPQIEEVRKELFAGALAEALQGTPLRPDFNFEQVSLRELYERLHHQGSRVDILHLVTHGSYGEGEQPRVMLEKDGTREVEWVTAVELAHAIGDAPLELVVLITCDGGTPDRAGGVSFGEALLKNSRISAVVAMRGRIEQSRAAEFTQRFYERLVQRESTEGGPPDIRIGSAVNWGRKYLRSLDSIDNGQEPWAWPAPVLFWRAGSRFPNVQFVRRRRGSRPYGDPKRDQWRAPPRLDLIVAGSGVGDWSGTRPAVLAKRAQAAGGPTRRAPSAPPRGGADPIPPHRRGHDV